MDSKKLTDAKVRDAKPSAKDYMLRDGEGLFLQVATTGEKWWRYRYTLHGKARKSGLGAYPRVTLAQARETRDAKRKLISAGIDPVEKKKAAKSARVAERTAQDNAFEIVAREWHASRSKNKKWSPAYTKKVLENLERNAFPFIGSRPVFEVTRADVRGVLEGERRGLSGAITQIPNGEAHKLRQIASKVFQYAISKDLTETNPADSLRDYLPEKKTQHYSAITEPRQVAELLHKIDGYLGSPIVRAALRVAPLLFVRPTELRHAEWAQFNLTGKEPEWRIPAARMKSGVEHRVPLAPQAIAILHELRPLTGKGRLLFPGLRTIERPISDNTINAALRTLGYSGDVMTGHGFRGMASTLLNELGWNRDAIESQLAHGPKDKVRAAYNHATYMPERRKMMQAWGDYLDGLRATRAKTA